MPSPTRSLYEALDCARALIETGETDAAKHGGWLGVILSATPGQVTELYEAAGMPVPVLDSRANTPAVWVPHGKAVPQRVMALLRSHGECSRADLARSTGTTEDHIAVSVSRLRKRGVKIETYRRAQGDKGYRLVECGAMEGN
jgi:biotin operon repressor